MTDALHQAIRLLASPPSYEGMREAYRLIDPLAVLMSVVAGLLLDSGMLTPAQLNARLTTEVDAYIDLLEDVVYQYTGVHPEW